MLYQLLRYRTQPVEFKQLMKQQIYQSSFKQLSTLTLLSIKLKMNDQNLHSLFIKTLQQDINQNRGSQLTIQSLVALNRLLHEKKHYAQADKLQIIEGLQKRKKTIINRVDEIVDPNVALIQIGYIDFLMRKMFGVKLDKLELLISFKMNQGIPINSRYQLRKWSKILFLVSDQKNRNKAYHQMYEQGVNRFMQNFEKYERLQSMISYVLLGQHNVTTIVPQSENYNKLMRKIRQEISLFTNSQILAILQFMIKIGIKEDDEDAFLLSEHLKPLTRMTQQIVAWRASIYFTRMGKFQEKLKECSLFLEYTSRSTLSAKQLTSRRQAKLMNLINKVLMMIPVYHKDYKYAQLDVDDFYKGMFRLHWEAINKAVRINDICRILDCVEIPYVREAIVGPYPIDLYIPSFPSDLKIDMTKYNQRWIANQQINQIKIIKIARSSSVQFENYQQMVEYVGRTQNSNSIFVDIDGPKHFIDSAMKLQKGGSKLKRSFLSKVTIQNFSLKKTFLRW